MIRKPKSTENRLQGVYFAGSSVATMRRQVTERTTLAAIQYVDPSVTGQHTGTIVNPVCAKPIYQRLCFRQICRTNLRAGK